MAKYILEVGDSDFDSEVLAYSNETPVVVDFWADWCVPCRALGPLLEKLALEADGAFRLAKVDVDANPRLALQYEVKSIPAVMAFFEGEVVAEFTGALGELEVREFLREIGPEPGDLALEKAQSLLSSGDWKSAGQIFGQVLEAHPDNSPALLGFAKSAIAQGDFSKALAVLNDFPASKDYLAAEQLLPLAQALAEETLEGEDEEREAAYWQALRLVKIGNIPAAIDGLLDILREDRKFHDGQIKKLVVALLHILGEKNPQTREYRQELSSILF